MKHEHSSAARTASTASSDATTRTGLSRALRMRTASAGAAPTNTPPSVRRTESDTDKRSFGSVFFFVNFRKPVDIPPNWWYNKGTRLREDNDSDRHALPEEEKNMNMIGTCEDLKKRLDADHDLKAVVTEIVRDTMLRYMHDETVVISEEESRDIANKIAAQEMTITDYVEGLTHYSSRSQIEITIIDSDELDAYGGPSVVWQDTSWISLFQW